MVRTLERLLGYVAASGLFGMMLLTFVDVVGRKFVVSIPGSLEITELLMLVVIFVGLPLASLKGEHVFFDLLDQFLPEGLRKVQAALANAIGQIGDRRAIPLLVALTKDDAQTKLGRAFAAAALGGVCERFALPWNLPLSRDANYGAPVDTLSNGATGVLDIL